MEDRGPELQAGGGVASRRAVPPKTPRRPKDPPLKGAPGTPSLLLSHSLTTLVDASKHYEWGSEMLSSEAPIRFAGTQLDRYRHVCAFFHDSDEECKVMLPFIKDGFDRGDRAFHIVDPVLWDDHLRRLRSAGIDVEAEVKRGALELRNWNEAYLREGHFDQDRMLALIEEILDQGPKKGFHLTRLVAHMEWALEDRTGVDDLVEYEARLNYLLPRYKDPVI